MRQHRRPQSGFSLVEVIVILVVAGFLGVLAVNLMGTQMSKVGIPLRTARQAASAEATLEKITAYYISNVNANTTGTLANVQSQFPNNATVQITSYSSTFPIGAGADNVPSLVVTVTEGQSSFTTVLTQERTNASDGAVTY